MPIPREQLSTAMLDYGECSESVVFQLENKVRIIERSAPLRSGIGWSCRDICATRIAGSS
jgi:hypothetical protein